VSTLALHLYIAARFAAVDLRARAEEEHGEGVISTAIAVLIMALLGAAMWAAFRGIFQGASDKAGGAVDSIGGGG
jgi:hypothetical protein